MTATAAPERLEFKTELKQLLDLIIHSLYTKREIFLRELISNAADAINKVRFESLTRPEILEGNSDWKIRLTADKGGSTLTVSDNGVGMSRELVVDHLGTIAKSGTRAFMENLKQANAQDRPELIGQFGVGFYSSFMVADRVTVVSKMTGHEAVKWESDGQGAYTVESAERSSRGTDVILHLREDAKEFLEQWTLRSTVKQYSDFIEYPIVLDVEKKEEGKTTTVEETLNSRQAIWLRSKAQIKPEEYNAFYKQISRDHEDPLKTIHIAADGQMEFRSILFIPQHKPMDFFYGQPKSGLQLYVKRVLIQHDCEELLPTWLRFVKGVVDSSDLPLNVSRETLQHNPLLAKIKTNLVNRILKTLEEMRDSEYETYLKFYKEFSAVLKEGVAQDWSNKERVADLLQFESTKTEAGKYTTLGKYVEAMPAEQKEIVYLVGETRAMLENSPYIETFKAKGQEVLLLTEPVDEFVANSLHEYKGKALLAADRAKVEAEMPEQSEKFKPLLDHLKGKLDEVKEVRLSSRLKESAACLVADENAPSAYLERLMQRMGREQEMGSSKRILELNPTHPVVQSMLALHEKTPGDPKIDRFAHLLLGLATLAEGTPLKDPSAFAKQVNDLMVKAI